MPRTSPPAPVDSIRTSLPKAKEIRSPKDGIIFRLAVKDRTKVKAQTLLCNLDPDDETRADDRVRLAEALLALEGRLLHPKQIALRRKVLEIALTTATKYAELADINYTGAKAQYETAVIHRSEFIKYQAFKVKADGEKEKATLALESFDFNIEQLKSRHALIKAEIPKETEFVKHKRDRLAVRASANGVVHFRVAVGSFVTKGSVIAEIE